MSRKRRISIADLGADAKKQLTASAGLEILPARRSVADRVSSALQANSMTSDDAMECTTLNPHARLSCFLPGAVLLSANDLLRTTNVTLSKYKKQWHNRFWYLSLAYRATYQSWLSACVYPLVIRFVYVSRHGNHMDGDGLTGAFKYVQDGLVRAGFVADDQQQHIVHPVGVHLPGNKPGLSFDLEPAPSPYGFVGEETVLRHMEKINE